MTFAPTAAQAYSGSLSVGFNGLAAQSTTLSGTGQQAVLSANATTQAFGSVAIGASSVQTYTLTNNGNIVATLGFTPLPSMVTRAGTCATTLGIGASCTVILTYAPTDTSTTSSSLTMSAPGTSITLSFSGTGVANPGFALSSTAVGFGTVATGTSSQRSVTVTNSGNVPLTTPAISTAGAGYSASHNCAATLAVAASCVVTLSFAPTAVQSYSGSLSVAYSNATAQTSALSGTGVGALVTYLDGSDAALATLSFPSTPVGSNSAALTVKVKNTGGANLVFTGAGVTVPAPFSLASSTCASATVVPNATCQVTVTFSPAAVQVYSGVSYQLSVQSNATGAGTLPLTGSGTAQGVMQVVSSPHSSSTFVQKTSGNWVAAGYNGNGQLGTGSTVSQNSFVAIPALNGATQVVTGAHHTLARLSSGNWVVAGYNFFGQLGIGSTTDQHSFVSVAALNGATQVAAGAYHTFARLSSGNWVATGSSSNGQLGIGAIVQETSFVAVPALNGATQVVTGNNHTLARLPSGNWVATGRNTEGQLGIGSTVSQNSFVAVTP